MSQLLSLCSLVVYTLIAAVLSAGRNTTPLCRAETQAMIADLLMPVIARFYGIVIKMYFSQSEHGIPHFHAVYGEYNGVFSIERLDMIEGDLPARAQRLIGDWACQHKNELLDIWTNQTFRQLPGLE